MSINNTKIKTITITMKNFIWNTETHDLLLSRDLNHPSGIRIKLVDLNDEKELSDMTLANELLKKFRKAA